jgi:hypothetical protein
MLDTETQLKIDIDKATKSRFKYVCDLNSTSMKQVIGDFILTYLSENKEVA